MPDIESAGWFRAWVATLLASTSVYGSLGLATGGALYLAALARGWPTPWAYFFAGTCITPGLFAFVNTTDFFFERRLRRLKRWLDEGLISQTLYEQHRKRAMEWRSSRVYGGIEPAKPAPTRPKLGP